MFAKLLLEPMHVRIYTKSNYQLKRWGSHKMSSYSNSLNSDKKILKSYEDFKRQDVEKYDEFKNSFTIKIICGDDNKKVSSVYDQYCQAQYNQYKQNSYGGNLSTIT